VRLYVNNARSSLKEENDSCQGPNRPITIWNMLCLPRTPEEGDQLFMDNSMVRARDKGLVCNNCNNKKPM